MTIIESGIIAGALAGASIGARIGAAYGWLTRLGSAGAGLIAGAVAGWVFAMLLICLLTVVALLWRALRRRASDPPSESDMRSMTHAAVPGTFVSALAALLALLTAGVWAGLLTLIAFACLTALLAVARCELRSPESE